MHDLSVKEALYHHERGRKYRPSRIEIETKSFSCPRCGETLISVKLRKMEKGYACPRCHWSIHRDDVWQPALESEPALREPGEATQDVTEMSVADVANVVPVLRMS